MLDAIATELDADRAPSLLARVLVGAPSFDGMDPTELSELVREHLEPALAFEVGVERAHAIAESAEALLAPLRRDRLLACRPAFRGPYILVSDVANNLEGIVDVRRVTAALDALVEADAIPDATLVVDTHHCAPCVMTLALGAADLPYGVQIVIVGASAAERARFEEISSLVSTVP